ncbi:PREDICTED: uncharacterized protein LOC109227864 [Nicotiana attenuata]|uniref:uncharacterized protein LOC109227864 n=1 Tax=Nicotiana attenuata TaxID=49451 RepID=UPI0009052EC9|nr:PREDICTED: uncharacterized protein LOC109227864 [Nicotiana attenuata]
MPQQKLGIEWLNTEFQLKNFPVKYLGCPLIAGRQKICHYAELITKIRVREWQTRLLSPGGKAILIRHVLQAIPIHLLSAMHPPKGVFQQIEKILASCFWRGSDGNDRHHWASWKVLCYPYQEDGAQFRRLQDVYKAFTVKSWWNLRTGCSLWRDFMLAKYCRRGHPTTGNVSFWYDNWTGQGALVSQLEEEAKPKDIPLSRVLRHGEWKLDALDVDVPDIVRSILQQQSIDLTPGAVDRAIWSANDSGKFTVASAWELLRQKQSQSPMASKIWHKQVPFKMAFTTWRAIHNGLPTDDRIAMFAINLVSMCSCCYPPSSELETVEHIFYYIASLIVKILPAVIIWELWRSRNASKYGEESPSRCRSEYNIIQVLCELVKQKFGRLQLQYSWEQLRYIVDKPVIHKSCIIVKWKKPPEGNYKLNTDGSCGAGGVIRDSRGQLVLAFSIYLGHGTNNWAESQAMLFGLQLCEANDLDNIQVETDSQILTSCMNRKTTTPWRMIQAVDTIKQVIDEKGFVVQHCFREENKVADKLAALGHTHKRRLVYTNYERLPRVVRGLIQLDKWEMASFRIRPLKAREIHFDPP